MLSRRRLLQTMSTALVIPPAAVRPSGPDRILVPAYFHPDVSPGEWEKLADPRLYAVVLNIDSGPGPAPVTSFATATRRIEKNGGKVTAYVDVSYARRDPALVARDIDRYRTWYGTTGVFFDQAPATPEALPYMRTVIQTARDAGADLIVLNHGTYPDPAYADLADLLITFEGPATTYLTLTPPSWPRSFPRHRFCHLIHTCPTPTLPRILSQLPHHHTGTTYITPRPLPNPYDTLPPYFPTLLTLTTP